MHALPTSHKGRRQERDSKTRKRMILSGSFDPLRNYSFEIYRMAVKLQLNGFIKRFNPVQFEIEVEGETDAIENFIRKMESMIKETNIEIADYFMDSILNYNEFRIINQKIF